MTEPDAPPPTDPAPIPPIEQRPEPQPPELPQYAGQGSQPPVQTPLPPPVPAPLPPPYSGQPSAPVSPSVAAQRSAPLPPPFSPSPQDPLPPPPQPPFTPPPPPSDAGPSPSFGAAPTGDGSGWAMAAHLTSLVSFGFSCLLIGLIGPLIVWLANKDRFAEVDWHGRESLNFQLNMLILWVVAWPLYCLCCLGAVIHFLQPVYIIVLVVIASIKAANGQRYRYPFTLRLLND